MGLHDPFQNMREDYDNSVVQINRSQSVLIYSDTLLMRSIALF